jgi:pyrimidine deaminase RibD-like protein
MMTGTGMYSEEQLRQWMRMAVDLGKQSGDPFNPYVGAVVVKDGKVIGGGHRGMTAPGDHAEFGVLKGLDPAQHNGATVFSTLEPCSQRNHPKIPCAQRLAEAGVAVVYVGIYDPNPVIYRQGWKMLTEAGVRVRDTADLLHVSPQRVSQLAKAG